MGRLMSYMLATAILLSGCHQRKTEQTQTDDLSTLKREFLQQIFTSDIEEGPFSFNYKFRTIFFSENAISLFGKLTVHDRLPHGWKQYEGKTLYKNNGHWKEVLLADLFQTDDQKEFLRVTCEDSLKNDPLSYFSGDNPLYKTLKYDDIHTFVLDDQHLIIVFQPYSVGGCVDGPFSVKIPINTLANLWEASHPFCLLLNKAIESRSFLSSWDLDDFYDRIAEVN